MSLGTALKLNTQTKDLVMKTNSDGVLDFVITEGREEAEQAIIIWLLTRQGTDQVDPQVGLPLDVMMGVRNVDFIEGVIKEALSLIPRIQEVGDMSANLEAFTRRLNVDLPVTLVDGTEITIAEAFGV